MKGERAIFEGLEYAYLEILANSPTRQPIIPEFAESTTQAFLL